MVNQKMCEKKKLLSIIEKLRSDIRWACLDEAATKQVVVLLIISSLGWDIYNFGGWIYSTPVGFIQLSGWLYTIARAS